jgi:hypothetical protein
MLGHTIRTGDHMPNPRYRGAIYYPYTRIENVDWLRANLILFPHVERMLPTGYHPQDPAGVSDFASSFKGEQPLLRPAKLYAPRPVRAQQELAKRLKTDAQDPTFLERFGETAARALRADNQPGFQIHQEKLEPTLQEALRARGLGWEPKIPDGMFFTEVHPAVGNAVMATIAIACAEASGLHVVGDERSGELQSCLLQRKLEDVYDTWLGREALMAPPRPPTDVELFDFILGVQANISLLSPEKLREINKDRQAINNLLVALRRHADGIAAMDPGDERNEALKETANDVLQAWKGDRMNAGPFFKKLIGAETGQTFAEFGTKIVEVVTTGGLGAVAAKEGLLGAPGGAPVFVAGAGLVFGLAVRATTTFGALRQREEHSPYKVLTTLERAGVVFRTPMIVAKGR